RITDLDHGGTPPIDLACHACQTAFDTAIDAADEFGDLVVERAEYREEFLVHDVMRDVRPVLPFRWLFDQPWGERARKVFQLAHGASTFRLTRFDISGGAASAMSVNTKNTASPTNQNP